MNQQQHDTIRDLSRFNDLDLIKYFKKYPESLAFVPLTKRLLMLGKREEALRICLNGLHHHDDFLEGRILLGKIYFQLKDIVNGVDILKGVIKRDPENVVAYFLIAKILLQEGHTEQGEALLMKAYELNPRDGEIKNCFKRYIKGEHHSTASFNIDQFMIRSEQDEENLPKKEPEKSPHSIVEPPKPNTPKRAVPAPIEDFAFLDDIEAEFSSGSKKIVRRLLLLVVIALAALPIYLFTQAQMGRSETTAHQKIITQFNQSPEKSTLSTLKKLPKDGTQQYYQLLYHFLLNKKVTQFSKITSENIYGKLYQLLQLLYQGNVKKFDYLVTEYRVDLKDQGEFYYIQGFRHLLNANSLNLRPLFQKALTLNPKNNRYKKMVATIHLKQQTYEHGLKLLLIDIDDTEFTYLKSFATNQKPPTQYPPLNHPESWFLLLEHQITQQQKSEMINTLKKLHKSDLSPYYMARLKQESQKIENYEILMK